MNWTRHFYTEITATAPISPPLMSLRNYSLFYGDFPALKNVSLDFRQNTITALIGPSGCGKTSLLRSCNRLHDLYPEICHHGEIVLNSADIFDKRQMKLTELRTRIGMVFQMPIPFPLSIADNVAYGMKKKGWRNRSEISDRVENALKKAALWKETADRLKEPALSLSGGQQQRLMIARALAVEPEILLFDEPTSALDPTSARKVEETILSLKDTITIVMVTHNLRQAKRLSDYTAFMLDGEIVEQNTTPILFSHPTMLLTREYIRDAFA